MEEGEDGSGDGTLKTVEDELVTPTNPSPLLLPSPCPSPIQKGRVLH